MHKLKIKSIHPINKSNHQINNPPPATNAAIHRHSPPISGDFSGEQKKKKKIRPLEVAAIHPNGQGERSGHPQWPLW
jgi:hypothetical protein